MNITKLLLMWTPRWITFALVLGPDPWPPYIRWNTADHLRILGGLQRHAKCISSHAFL